MIALIVCSEFASMAPALRLLLAAAAAALAPSASAGGQLVSLDGTWQLRDSSSEQQQQQQQQTEAIDAAVPGTVQTALFAAARAPDPQFGYNQLDVFHAAAASTFTYSRTFPTPTGGCSSTAGQQRCDLIFDGIDTAANLTLNGAPLGQANDMVSQPPSPSTS